MGNGEQCKDSTGLPESSRFLKTDRFLSAAEAREYILALITTCKMTEKEIHSLEDEVAKWQGRMDLARSRGAEELFVEAEKEAEKVNAKLGGLREELRSHKSQIETIRKQLPGLAARERSIDADLLEQELLMALGKTEEEAETERTFRNLERKNAADAALQDLKNKLNQTENRGD